MTDKIDIDQVSTSLVTSKAELQNILIELRSLLAENKLKANIIHISISKIEKQFFVLLSFLILITLSSLFIIYSNYTALIHMKTEHDCLITLLLAALPADSTNVDIMNQYNKKCLINGRTN